MVTFIDQHRGTYGVEPICAVLPIAPSTYFVRKCSSRTSRRGRRAPGAMTSCVPRSSGCGTTTTQVYGPRKVWKQLRCEGHQVARCTVERLMRAMGLHGVSRGRAWVTTTRPDAGSERPADLVAEASPKKEDLEIVYDTYDSHVRILLP
jgi:hypothetical protein